MTDEIRKKIEEAADEYGFVVPYDGSNIFYKPNAVEGFMAGAEFGYQIAQEEKKFKPCGEGENICSCKSESECGYLKSQDELIVEFASLFMSNKPTDERVEEAKKRYRITRITSESKEPKP